jgi:hypothetical protein
MPTMAPVLREEWESFDAAVVVCAGADVEVEVEEAVEAEETDVGVPPVAGMRLKPREGDSFLVLL